MRSLVIAAAIGGVLLVCLWTPASAAPPAAPQHIAEQEPDSPPAGPAPALRPEQPKEPETDLPPEFFAALPPHSRIGLRLPAGLTSGLRCPDGSFLPLLNGVPEAAPIQRLARYGPLPPVVAKRTDAGGDEWYEHADGSLTTTRWVEVTALGVTTRDVETTHCTPNDQTAAVSLAPAPRPTAPAKEPDPLPR